MPDPSEADFSTSRTFKITGEALNRLPSASLVGSVIDSKYSVTAFLGEGGMGAVYRARHLSLNKDVALKALLTDLISDEAWQRFQREAQAIGRLTHANIVQVFDFGTSEQKFPYYTMELLTGESMHDRLARVFRLPLVEALTIFAAVANALAHAHRQGIVHRDVKPGNIFLVRSSTNPGDVPRVVDFGLAKLAEGHSRQEQSLTIEGLIFGSPLYMSPEQSQGLPTDQRTDIYSYGCSLFHALTGTPPFMGKTSLSIISMHQKELPPSLIQAAGENCDSEFSLELEAIVAKLLAKNMDRRYQCFEDVERDLVRVLNSIYIQQFGTSFSPEALVSSQQAVVTAKYSTEQKKQRQAEVETTDKGQRPRALWGLALASLMLSLGLAAFFFYTAPPPHVDGDQVADLHAANDSANRKYFASDTADGGRTFDFPVGKKLLGTIEWSTQKMIPASGKIYLPPNTFAHIYAGELLSENPKLFRRFRADDIQSLNFLPEFRWTEEHYREIGRLTGLKAMDIMHCRTRPEYLASLKALIGLEELHAGQNPISGEDLATLPFIEHLDVLDAGEVQEMRPVLKKLAGSSTIHNLSLKDCDLKDDDLEIISSMPNISLLAIDFNPITVKGLRSLKRLPKLESLRMAGIAFSGDVIDVLVQFKRLKHLRIQVAGWPESEIQRLLLALPHCNIEKYGAGVSVSGQ